MTLRRLLWASPLSVSVAVLAHLVAFGSDHAPGGSQASALLEILCATLTLGLVGSFIGGFFARPPMRIATEPSCRYGPLLLAAGGAAAYGLIELSEGHLALSALLTALLSSLPLAYFITFAARYARSAARHAGVRCAALMRERPDARGSAQALLWGACGRRAASPVFSGARQGRAPPTLT